MVGMFRGASERSSRGSRSSRAGSGNHHRSYLGKTISIIEDTRVPSHSQVKVKSLRGKSFMRASDINHYQATQKPIIYQKRSRLPESSAPSSLSARLTSRNLPLSLHSPPLRARLINLHTINQPIRLPKHPRILLQKRLTCRRLGRTTALCPNMWIACPLTAERRIKQNAHIPEMRINITLPRKRRHRHPPRTRVRRLNIRRDLAPRKRPDLNPLARHLRRYHRTTLLIENRAIARSRRVLDLAPCVLALRGVTDIAITCRQRP